MTSANGPIADVVWPALFLGSRLVGLAAVSVGLVVEFGALWLVLKLPWRRALLADLVMNFVSVVPGTAILAAAGIGWEYFPGSLLYRWLHVGTFNPVTWAATYLMAVAINAALEAATLRILFKVPFTLKVFVTLIVANAASVAIAGVGLYIRPPRA
jgi:hypothetical protein